MNHSIVAFTCDLSKRLSPKKSLLKTFKQINFAASISAKINYGTAFIAKKDCVKVQTSQIQIGDERGDILCFSSEQLVQAVFEIATF